jgi:RNA processing factor Prp31
MKIIYTGVEGIYVFDDSYNIIRDLKLEIKETSKIANGDWIEKEKQLIKKYKDDKLIFLGFKNKKIDGVILSQDIKKLEGITKKLGKCHLKKGNEEISTLALKDSFDEEMLIIQGIRVFDTLRRVENTIIMRLRDFFDIHIPEISEAYPENEDFIEKIKDVNKTKKELNLESTIGCDIKKKDVDEFYSVMGVIESIQKEQRQKLSYIEKIMKKVCPNVLAVAGTDVGARLLALAGSMKKLARMPYSTLQLLGAEKALFRHLRRRAKSPKHGVIITHPLVSSSRRKGRAARVLAEKLSMCARVDYFKGEYIADKLLKELKKKLK